MVELSQDRIDAYAKEYDLLGLTKPTLVAIINKKNNYTLKNARKFLLFQERINNELLQHEVINNNSFTSWFQSGKISTPQLSGFIVQFSVFSNLFLIAQLHKMINADSVESMRASKEILANEIGVIFKGSQGQQESPADSEDGLVSTVGSIEGGQFRFQAAHFEWLLRLADKLGIPFEKLGKRAHGTVATLFFCDELVRLYGSDDYITAQAASYAVENWAAAGFWDALIEGFEKYNAQHKSRLPLSFFTWHSKIEAQHALHTQEELEEIYFSTTFNETEFIAIGNEMLDGVFAFWKGLDQQRSDIEK